MAIATFKTSNTKTGAVIQTWILRADRDPVQASKASLDGAVCGDCPHRHSLGGACYVTLFQAPLGVWRAWDRGNYTPSTKAQAKLDALKLAGNPVRLGAYGDPAAVPTEVWCDLLDGAQAWTGYTHQWHKPVAAPLRTLCMASVDSELEAAQARALGWRTFRVVAPGDPEPDNPAEIECLSDSRGLTCAQCRLCNGARPDGKQPRSIWIDVHGARSRRFKPKALAVLP